MHNGRLLRVCVCLVGVVSGRVGLVDGLVGGLTGGRRDMGCGFVRAQSTRSSRRGRRSRRGRGSLCVRRSSMRSVARGFMMQRKEVSSIKAIDGKAECGKLDGQYCYVWLI